MSEKVCPHPERKRHAKGLCASCYAINLRSKNLEYRQKHAMYQRGWHRRNPDKAREHKRRYHERHPEKTWRFSDPLKRRNAHIKYRLRKKYGLVLAEYQRLLSAQSGTCAICGDKFSPKVPHVDHDHKTGLVRGILCATCNWGLGSFKDNVDLMEKAITYLRRFQ